MGTVHRAVDERSAGPSRRRRSTQAPRRGPRPRPREGASLAGLNHPEHRDGARRRREPRVTYSVMELVERRAASPPRRPADHTTQAAAMASTSRGRSTRRTERARSSRHQADEHHDRGGRRQDPTSASPSPPTKRAAKFTAAMPRMRTAPGSPWDAALHGAGAASRRQGRRSRGPVRLGPRRASAPCSARTPRRRVGRLLRAATDRAAHPPARRDPPPILQDSAEQQLAHDGRPADARPGMRGGTM